VKYIKKFKELKISDVPLVGGKNASLGQMIAELSRKHIKIPGGFAITAQAYWDFIDHNDLRDKIATLLSDLKDYKDIKKLKKIGSEIRELIQNGEMFKELEGEITQAYIHLCDKYKQKNLAVAVRSSATAEDLPTASFAGQQETFLNVSGAKDLLLCCKKSMASLFTDRAIVYRIEQGFDHMKVALSVGVQKMVRSDLASAGVIFTLDTETGFKDIVMINSAYGLGEIVVKGEVIPDEFLVHKPTLEKGFKSIVKKSLGDKSLKVIYNGEKEQKNSFTKTIDTSEQEQNSFSLSDKEILELACAAVTIEEHYSEINNKWMPMDIEWAKDGDDGELYILQARPETVHAHTLNNREQKKAFKIYKLKESGKGDSPANLAEKVLITGQSIGNSIVSGTVRVIASVKDIGLVQTGDVLVTQMTDPDWVPAMKKAAGIITNRGGRTCHAAIVSRELGIAAIVGAKQATEKLQTGQEVTIDCSQGNTGYVYEGAVPFEEITLDIEKLSTAHVPCDVMVNIADPDRAFAVSFLPNDGVGLARVEFIINNFIKIHPMVFISPETLRYEPKDSTSPFAKAQFTPSKIEGEDRQDDREEIERIEYITRAYKNKKSFFIDNLAYGISTIAAAFYPKPVIVRLSDFKTNEYRNLIGGKYFEPEEENPMLGWRGASRYYHKEYKEAFALECAAIKKARDEIGLQNIKIMIPFVRTITEAQKVLQELEHNGLKKEQHSKGKENSLEIVMMCEVPSNVILIEEFCNYFDGFSIGSNDLTQLTLGVDRDSELLSKLFDERDQAVKQCMAMAVKGALKHGKFIGICGQAPSDFSELANFLIETGISSISLNPDALVPFLLRHAK